MKRDRSLLVRRREFTDVMYKGNRLLAAFTLLLFAIDAVVNTAFAWLLQTVTDIAAGVSSVKLSTAVLFTVSVLVAVTITGTLEMEFKANYVRRGISAYKNHVFGRIARKSISAFNNESTSKYISMLTNDVANIEENYLNGPLLAVFRSIMFVLAIFMMFWYDWLMALITIAVCMIPMVVSMLFGNGLAESERRVSERSEGFVGMVKDMLTGFTLIKSFGAEAEAEKLFTENNSRLEKEKYRRSKRAALIELIMSIAGLLLQLGIFILGAYFAQIGRVTAGVVVAYMQLTGLLMEPVRTIPPLLAKRKAAAALIDKMAVALEDNVERKGRTVVDDIGGGIELSDVHFAYEEDEVLHGISCRFERGKSYALVGGSGSGKTTLLNLLLGYYENYKGDITVAGVQLRDIDSASLCALISVIQQNVFIFDSTMENNITMFRSFERDKTKSAAERAGLSQLIAEKGWEYMCGENGAGLSGGEKQRISIARALLAETPIMLADEATAALDAETAFAVTSAILNIEGLTRIVVTHRLDEALLRRYDEIVVLRSGAIVERGSFDKLMAQRGYFASLYNVAQ